MKNVQKVRSLVALAFVTTLVLVPAVGALADAGTVVAQETPYQAPDIEEARGAGLAQATGTAGSSPAVGSGCGTVGRYRRALLRCADGGQVGLETRPGARRRV